MQRSKLEMTDWRPRFSRIMPIMRLFGWLGRRQIPRLDLQAAPDSVKRDLGIMDGRLPYREEEPWPWR